MQLIFLDIFIVGVGILILLFVRALPRVGDTQPLKRGVLERWLTSKLPERLDSFARTVFLRTMRRVKVLILRINNGIDEKLQRMKLESGDGIRRGEKAEKINLKKVAEQASISDTDKN